MRFLTSLISGTLSIVTSRDVSNVALITCNASFFAPWGTISPLSGLPPSIMNDAMDGLWISVCFFYPIWITSG